MKKNKVFILLGDKITQISNAENPSKQRGGINQFINRMETW